MGPGGAEKVSWLTWIVSEFYTSRYDRWSPALISADRPLAASRTRPLYLRNPTGLLRCGEHVGHRGVWAYVNPRVVPTPPEFEVPAPAVAAAHLAMLRYKIAALDCYTARIAIERDVMGLPECATLPETPRKKQSKSEARLRDEARKARCHQLMVDLELATTCRRPDIAAYATQLSAELGSEPTAKVTRP